ncbi:MAG: hypothetical protein ACO2ZM_02110 [Francisellaceae bacterium]
MQKQLLISAMALAISTASYAGISPDVNALLVPIENKINSLQNQVNTLQSLLDSVGSDADSKIKNATDNAGAAIDNQINASLIATIDDNSASLVKTQMSADVIADQLQSYIDQKIQHKFRPAEGGEGSFYIKGFSTGFDGNANPTITVYPVDNKTDICSGFFLPTSGISARVNLSDPKAATTLSYLFSHFINNEPTTISTEIASDNGEKYCHIIGIVESLQEAGK